MSPPPEPSPTAPQPVVELRDAVAVLGSFPVLAGANLLVEEGELVLLRGPNGAGKTSLLRVCAGLLPLSRGSGTVCGVDLVGQRRLVRSRVGLLGHANGLYADLTVDENLRFWGATVGARTEEIHAARQRMAIAERLATVPVDRLSAGQKRRLALACMIVRRARLWLLDEPHASLDAAARDQLDEVLVQATAAGATVIVASHELERWSALHARQIHVAGGALSEVDAA